MSLERDITAIKELIECEQSDLTEEISSLARDFLRITSSSFPKGCSVKSSESYYRSLLESSDTIYVTVEENGERVGFLTAIPHNKARATLESSDIERTLMRPDPSRYYVVWTVVLPEHQGKGLCSKMLDNLAEKLHQRGIHKISMHSRTESGLSDIIQRKLHVTEKRRIDQSKYSRDIASTDYIEAYI